MPWTERQRAMLREMGVEPWPEVAVDTSRLATDVGTQELARVPPAAPAPAAPPSAAVASPGRTSAAPASAVAEGGAARAPFTSLAPAPGGEAASEIAAQVAHMDWPALQQAVVGCTACGLCQSRRQTVFGIGHVRAHWMVVGEAPGEQEDLAGEPFVGKSGLLLDNMLRAVGLTRQPAPPEQQVYIANTIKCRPPGNRNPQPEELAHCEPFLARQVALVQPRIILAMGRFAVQSLLRSAEPIGRLRGRVHDFQGVPLVVTYHPAYLLRSPEEKARAWDDLCLALETVKACTAPQ
jgi:uracil-DNA glycosylase